MSAPNPPDATRPILTDAAGMARLFTICERGFHELRRRPDFPPDATVILGGRAVRFRVAVLERWCGELAAASVPQAEPERLKRARQTKAKAGARA